MKRIADIANGTRRQIVERMYRDDYNFACGLNPSSICQKSPLHVRNAYESPYSESTPQQTLGTLCHTLLWEPHLFEDSFVYYDGTRRGAAWEEFREEHDGTLILAGKTGREMIDKAALIGASLYADPLVKHIAREGIAETAVFTVEHGLQCRGLIDWVNTADDVLCDLKVCKSIEHFSFGRAVQDYSYLPKMALYRRWLERESGKRIQQVKFITVESHPPFDVAVVPVDLGLLDSAYEQAQLMIQEVAQCIESGEWPGIARGQEYPLHIPAWAMDEMEVDLE